MLTLLVSCRHFVSAHVTSHVKQVCDWKMQQEKCEGGKHTEEKENVKIMTQLYFNFLISCRISVSSAVPYRYNQISDSVSVLVHMQGTFFFLHAKWANRSRPNKILLLKRKNWKNIQGKKVRKGSSIRETELKKALSQSKWNRQWGKIDLLK